MITISGIFKAPDATILSGVVIIFTLLKTTETSYPMLSTQIITSDTGEYSVNLSAGVYEVTLQYTDGKTLKPGNIVLKEGDVPGTLNDFLLLNKTPDDSVYSLVSSFLSNPVMTFASYADLPSSPSGLYLIIADETKSGGPSVYLFKNGIRYWLAMVEDA